MERNFHIYVFISTFKLNIKIYMNESIDKKLSTYDPLNPCKLRALFSSGTANSNWHLLPDKAIEKIGAKVQELIHVNKTQIAKSRDLQTNNRKTEDHKQCL